ncbi:MAG: DNA translocase FtsK 4TM domain-containing protein [Pseudomonadota bacterium]
MAYQTRQRDPFLDSHMQAMLNKRGKELIGVSLMALGVILTLILWTYSPEDPNFLTATDTAPQNAFGRLGASIAAVLMMVTGLASWVFALALVVWALRFLLHSGTEQVWRIVFLPIAVAMVSVYSASFLPAADWTHSFGLGGLFGDTVLATVVTILPFNAALGLKAAAALACVTGIALSAFVLGVSRFELDRAARYLLLGLLVVFNALIIGARKLGLVAWQGAGRLHEGQLARREARRLAREEAAVQPQSASPRRRSFVPIRRAPSPEPVLEAEALNPELPERAAYSAEINPPSEGQIRQKIADAVRSRAIRADSPMQDRIEPPLSAASAASSLDVHALDTDWAEPDPTDLGQPLSVPYSERSAVLGAPQPSGKVIQPSPKRTAPSRQAQAEAQPSLPLEDRADQYDLPPLTLLESGEGIQRMHLSDEALEENARMLESVLDDYGVKGEIVSVRPGPVVTMYELEPAPGLKASRVIGLADDIARSMSALSARVSTVPGRSVIGIELPNQHREKVVLREILSSRDYGDGNHRLPLALGKDIGGDPVIANLAKMPHLLIAGTTGSGKSVAINTMILSLLYKLTPAECRLIMIDPKMLELSVYDGIPHLLSPVVTDPKKAVVALKWVVAEMEERYRKMSKMGVRNIEGYNGRVADALSKGELFQRTVQTGFDDETGEPVFETEEFAPETMPFIVVVVDEMADLMMVAGKEIEACIQRLAQMARASGIHLIMATQRPSVDVITGTIKANFPTRISFHVTSKVDSRTILGEMGAEQLLGMGDMLYMAGGAKITRVHGPFVSDEEVEEIVSHLKSFGAPDYTASVLDGPDDEKESDIDLVLGLGGNTDGEDALYDQAVQIVIQDRKCSTSYIQRKLAIGYNKAARLVEQMEEAGLVSAANHVGKRDILVPEQA